MRSTAIAFLSIAIMLGCGETRRENTVLSHRETEAAIAELRAAYAAFNRGDIDTAVRFLDPH
jgi:hypothetical protein